MEIFDCKLEGLTIMLTMNLLAIVLIAAILIIMPPIFKFIYHRCIRKSVIIEEAKIGIGSSSVTIKYDARVKEIAYKIWVELKTRKIGIAFDENDVIIELYNSWYEAFKVIRELLKDFPPERIKDSKGLIDITSKVLNNCLRPHLTKWQSKYRKWYEFESKKYPELSPQEIQKKYENYEDLVSELKKVNVIILNYVHALEEIIEL